MISTQNSALDWTRVGTGRDFDCSIRLCVPNSNCIACMLIRILREGNFLTRGQSDQQEKAHKYGHSRHDQMTHYTVT